MRNKLGYFLLIFNLLVSFAWASSSVQQIDTTKLVLRNFDNIKIDSLKVLEEFNYKENIIEETASIWTRFWAFVRYVLKEFFNSEGVKKNSTLIYLILGLACLAFVVFIILKMNKNSLIAGESLENPDLNFKDLENIHEVDFDVEIANAVKASNFRLAIRLLYLKALKELSAKNLINWDASKTNLQYINELKNQNIKSQFADLTFKFEYAWYGNFSLEPVDFKIVESEFSSFYKSMK